MLREHRTSVTGTAAVPSRPTPSGPRSPAEVREEVRYALAEARRSRREALGGDEIICDALLVASELTTNAMLHGGGVTGFEVTLDDQEVRLSVSDRSEQFPGPAQHGDERGFMRPGGHGWPIVCRLARDITISELRTGGKRITAVVPLRHR
ncbi:ATP-binding protein [Streptomyces sp. NPDC057621]|uniref:ATP-binding protein n=1 Tax=Streptomyces liliiviolaceus TaxID=2823109 RepID=A0A940XXH9_9ACTN|nr:ATP-binding protein [Streptomyces liliiviolaceus]MBQ0851528.1 ATP-binding protein [Streptomyces liliiviolaceus]